MSVLDSVEAFFKTTEVDVLALIVDIKKGAEVFEADLKKAVKWVGDNAPQIASDVESVLGVVTELGIAADPRVAIAIEAANAAVTALNAVAEASKSGKSDVTSIVDGFVAVKQAQSAAASAAAAVASAPPAKAA